MADRRFAGLLEIGAASKELGSGANRGEPERTRLFITPMDSPVDGGDFNLSFRAAETDAARARENRRWLRFVVGRPVSCLHQVHSARVLDLDQVLEGTAFGDGDALAERLVPLQDEEADGQVTVRRDVALAAFSADCTPVAFVDKQDGVFGTCHSGRRGTEQNIVGAVVDAMRSKGAHAANISCWIGPHICGNCYETGEKIADAFAQRFPDVPGAAALTRFGGPGIDMGAAIAAELRQAGIPMEHIHTSDDGFVRECGKRTGRTDFMAFCTLENPLLYSYREYTLTSRPRCNGRFALVLVP